MQRDMYEYCKQFNMPSYCDRMANNYGASAKTWYKPSVSILPSNTSKSTGTILSATGAHRLRRAPMKIGCAWLTSRHESSTDESCSDIVD